MTGTQKNNRLQKEKAQTKKKGQEYLSASRQPTKKETSCTLFLLNGRTQILKASHQAQRLLHTPEETLINSTLSSFINNEYKIKFHHHINQALSSDEEQSCQVELINMQGEKIKLLLKSHRVYDNEQEAFLVKTWAGKDTSGHMFNVEPDVVHKHKIHLLFENFSEGIFFCNEKGIITYCNNNLKNLINEDITGSYCYEKIFDTTKNESLFSKTGDEQVIRHKPTGKTLLITHNQLPEEYENLNFAVVRDISPFVTQEKRLKKRQQFIEFISKKSKDLIAAKPESLKTEFLEILQFIASHIKADTVYLYKQLLGVIEDILDMSKIESNQIKPHPRLFNLNEMIDDLIRIYRDPVKNPKQLEIKGEKHLKHSEAFIKTDEGLLKRIYTSLLDNAIKFTEAGSVVFGYETEKKHLKFFVKDTGIGIDEKYKHAIFERFRQAEEAETREYGGTGLGLAIAKSFIELLGGNIWVESKINSGANFYFTLPHKNQAGNPGAKKNLQLKEAWRNQSILIVDDNDDIHTYMKEIFEETGANFISAHNGEQAIKTIVSNPVDLVLLDLQMPKMNGFETCQEIKQYNPDTPVIIQTAYSDPGDVRKAKTAGCDALVTKPLNSSKLFRIISSHLKVE
ncbi:MAG: response regulator [Bacteroidota bacterium]